MKVIVCIKPVKTEFVYPNELRNEAFVMNPYDLYALEKTLELKKKSRCEIVCLCMGPDKAEGMLKKVLAMGVDEAILVTDRVFVGSDTVATTYIIGKAIEKVGHVDLIVCGEKSVDGETGQVAIGLSERFKQVYVNKLEEFLEVVHSEIVLQRQDREKTEKIKIHMPAVLVFSKSRITPPNVSLMALKRVKNKPIIYWNSTDLGVEVCKCGLEGSKTKVLNVKNDIVKKLAERIEGTDEEKSQFIYSIACKYRQG